ncbi:DUF1501 domain-containing protein [Pseudoalteromonas sp. Hal099]
MFCLYGGFDTHDDQLTAHPALLNTLAQGLSEFNSAMKELNMNDKVTTFTMSDFGRTLTSNGDGTDHGWAGNQIVMGGAVKVPFYLWPVTYSAIRGRIRYRRRAVNSAWLTSNTLQR